MEDTLISFETAKLAKEKGFNALCDHWYFTLENGMPLGTEYTKTYPNKFIGYTRSKETEHVLLERSVKGYSVNDKFKNDPLINLVTSAPSQSLLQKWLREKHNINVESNYLSNIQAYRCIFKPKNIIPKSFKTRADFDNAVSKYYGKINYDSYEEALEAGLIEGLKLIK